LIVSRSFLTMALPRHQARTATSSCMIHVPCTGDWFFWFFWLFFTALQMLCTLLVSDPHKVLGEWFLLCKHQIENLHIRCKFSCLISLA
jgi:hypothetical protein